MQIRTRAVLPTSRYGAHMGTCQHFPGYVEAWVETCKDDPVYIELADEMTLVEATNKAVAILRRRLTPKR